MKVTILCPLPSYTHRRDVEADGATLAELLVDLDPQNPGPRFWVIDEQGFPTTHSLHPDDSVQIVQALSGGWEIGSLRPFLNSPER